MYSIEFPIQFISPLNRIRHLLWWGRWKFRDLASFKGGDFETIRRGKWEELVDEKLHFAKPILWQWSLRLTIGIHTTVNITLGKIWVLDLIKFAQNKKAILWYCTVLKMDKLFLVNQCFDQCVFWSSPGNIVCNSQPGIVQFWKWISLFWLINGLSFYHQLLVAFHIFFSWIEKDDYYWVLLSHHWQL